MGAAFGCLDEDMQPGTNVGGEEYIACISNGCGR